MQMIIRAQYTICSLGKPTLSRYKRKLKLDMELVQCLNNLCQSEVSTEKISFSIEVVHINVEG